MQEIDPVKWQRRRAKSLIKILALAPEHRLHREQIIDLLWPDLKPQAGANNFHQTLYIARRILETTEARAPRFLTLEDDFLTLAPADSFWSDVEAFEAAVTRALQSHKLADYKLALDLYGGELLPEDRYEDWAHNPREVLRQKFLSLWLGLAELYRAGRNHEQAITAFNQALEIESTDETAHRSLIELYVTMRRRDLALRQYETLRETLRHELDTEPSRETQRLYEQVLRGDLEPIDSRSTLPGHNLPLQLTSFVGRTREKGEVKRLLTRTRLLTLTGPGGCGKTRLALEVASNLLNEYADGVWLAELAPLTDESLVARAVAAAFGVSELPSQALTETLANYLKPRQTLLVLDNCEHLIDACARFADSLLRVCPEFSILATSREPLRISGELTWLVPSLTVPDPSHLASSAELLHYEAIQLFNQRASSLKTTFIIGPHNATSIARVCYRLDGMPLAIELAAARVKLLSIEQIESRLDQRFQLLTSGSRNALTRQQTLRATVDWSFDLLSENERILFRRLSVFAGNFSLDAVEVICRVDDLATTGVVDLLSNLVDKSLVLVEERSGETTYRLLETIREYARERLLHAGEDLVVQQQHAAWYVEWVERANANLWGAAQLIWLDRLENQHDNLRAALAWCLRHDTRSGLRLAASLWQFWIVHGHLVEARQWLEGMLARAPDRTALRANALLSLCAVGFRAGLNLTFDALAEESQSIYQELGDARGRIVVYQFEGARHSVTDDYQRGKFAFELCLALAEAAGLKAERAIATHFLGVLAQIQGDYPQAQELLVKSLALFQELADQPGVSSVFINVIYRDFMQSPGLVVDEETLLLLRQVGTRAAIGYALANLGILARQQGEFGRAKNLFEESLSQFREIGDRAGIGQVLGQLGNLARDSGEFNQARACLEQSLAIRREIGERRGIGRTLNNLANLAMVQADHKKATMLVNEALSLFREMEDKPGLGATYTLLGNLAMAEGDYDRAAALYEMSLSIFRELTSIHGVAMNLVNLAESERARGNGELARAHLASSLSILQRWNHRPGIAAITERLRNLPKGIEGTGMSN